MSTTDKSRLAPPYDKYPEWALEFDILLADRAGDLCTDPDEGVPPELIAENEIRDDEISRARDLLREAVLTVAARERAL